MTAARIKHLKKVIDASNIDLIDPAMAEIYQCDTLAQLASVHIDAYSEHGAVRKAKFHKMAKRQLKRLANSILLAPGSYDIRSNKGGIAVTGEITLHGHRLYVQVSQSCFGARGEILYRYCNGRTDYTGGPNNYAEIGELDNHEEFARKLRRAHQFGLVELA